MRNVELRDDEAPSDEERRRPAGRAAWVEVALPACVVLVISIPTMVLEENWHGRPMIDGGNLWILPALLVAAAFLLGGALAGLRSRSAPVAHAAAAAGIAVAVLLLGAVIRRLGVVHEGVPGDVVRLWVIGAAGAIGLSVLGSLLGRRVAAQRG